MNNQQRENLSFQLNIRLTHKEGEVLKQTAQVTGQSQTQLIRSVIRPILQILITSQAVTPKTSRSNCQIKLQSDGLESSKRVNLEALKQF
jgi:uncharacterized protein (DUF1778 family)